jgi:HK97 family phage major capsid protein
MLARQLRDPFGLPLYVLAKAASVPDPGPWAQQILEAEVRGHVTNSQYEHLERVIKAAGIVVGDNPLQESMLSSFAADLGRFSAFDRVLNGGAVRLPLRTRVALVTAAIAGAIVGVGKPKPCGAITLDGQGLTPLKAVAFLVATQEFFQVHAVDGAQLFENELGKAVGRATDDQFVNQILLDGTPASSPSSGSLLADLRLGLAALPANSGARYYLLAHPSTVKQIATAEGSNGQPLFVDVDAARGGVVSGVEIVPCDALEADSSGAQAVLLDASQVLAGAETPQLSLARQASLDMATPPTSDATTGTGSNAVSLWQTNGVGVRIERAFSAQLARPEAAFLLEDVDYSEAQS